MELGKSPVERTSTTRVTRRAVLLLVKYQHTKKERVKTKQTKKKGRKDENINPPPRPLVLVGCAHFHVLIPFIGLVSSCVHTAHTDPEFQFLRSPEPLFPRSDNESTTVISSPGRGNFLQTTLGPEDGSELNMLFSEWDRNTRHRNRS